jgi:tyrosyl-tRNA synthetase
VDAKTPSGGPRPAWQAGSVASLFDDLSWRGLVHQLTDDETLPGRLDGDRMVLYIGFDPTARSLHVGHLQQICLLRRFQDAGHRPIALVGGGTGMIGDPSGKSEERNLLAPEELDANRAGVARQLSQFLDFGGPAGAVLTDNAEWLRTTGLLDFLRDVGKLFSVNEMIRKESVRARLEGREQSLSFTEFSYMLLQAWDFLQLYDRYGCELQLGGSDQWGNITEGIDLIRRRRGVPAYGLTSPLVTKADGSKFGKTESGNVWLAPALTSPYEFFQFWLRSSDAEVGSYLRRFTFLSRARIEELEEATATQPERRQAQRALAVEVTAMVHGKDEARRAQQAAAVLFTSEIATLDPATLALSIADAPTIEISASALDGDLTVLDALLKAGLAESRRNARQLLSQGSVYINGERVPEDRPLGSADALHGRWVVLRRGRSRQCVLVVAG